MAIGPYPGNGFIWQHGPYTIGVWSEPDQGGFGEPCVIGHKDITAGWQVDGTIAQETPGGWQYNINTRFPDPAGGPNGLQGAYVMNVLVPKINAVVPQLYPINSHPQPVQNTEPYALDTINALFAQYLEATPDGLLKQKGT